MNIFNTNKKLNAMPEKVKLIIAWLNNWGEWHLWTPLVCCVHVCSAVCVRWPISPLSSWLWPFKGWGAESGESGCLASCEERIIRPSFCHQLYWPLASLIMRGTENFETGRGKSERRKRGGLIRLERGGWLGKAGVVQTTSLMSLSYIFPQDST